MSDERSERHPVDELAEDFVARFRRGERPSVSEYARRYPELAEQISEVLQALVLIEQLGPGPEEAVPASTEGPPLRQLGEFQIIREVGRGGMGVVYEAVQESLGRHVALKVLAGDALLSPTHRQRFQQEARAAARLHHSNIVPVFGVGEHAGVHYYAMQFIQGQALDAVLREIKRLWNNTDASEAAPAASTQTGPSSLLGRSEGVQSYFRNVAQVGLQVAEALAYAHEQGVLHRDIKPANLLLDAQGTVWVTDFGLAKTEANQSLTSTGDIVGTLRYMAPERFNGWSDPRSDVYALGVTLYELVTLRPAFEEADRNRLIKQILHEEPPRPRKLDRRLPQDLETIVLKAQAKEPGDRYLSAGELGADLRAFLADRPIQARRTSALEQTWRWCRRNRALAALAVVVVLVLATGAGSIGWVMRDRAATRREVGRAVEEGWRLHGNGQWAEALAEAQRAQGLLAGGAADEKLRQLVQDLLADLEEDQRDRRLLARLQEATLQASQLTGAEHRFNDELAIPEYEAAFQEYGIDRASMTAQDAVQRIGRRPPETQLALIATLDLWIDEESVFGKKSDADLEKLVWLKTLVRATDTDPWRTRVRDAAERKEFTVLAELARAPDLDQQAPYTLERLGALLCLRTKTRDLGLAVLRRAQQTHAGDFRINRALGWELLHAPAPQSDDAVRFLACAVVVRPDHAGARLNLGLALRTQGKLDEAVATYRKAIALKPDYAPAYSHLGLVLVHQGKMDEAVAAYRKATALRPGYAPAHNNLGLALAEQGKLDEAIAACRKALALRPNYSEAYDNLGHALAKQGHPEEAIAALRKAIALKPDNAIAHGNLGFALHNQGKLVEAMAAYREAIALKPDFPEAHYNLANALRDQGKTEEAIAAYRKAIAVKPDFPQAHNNLGDVLLQKGDVSGAIAALQKAIALKPDHAGAHASLSAALRAQGSPSGAVAVHRKTVALREQEVKKFPTAPVLHSRLGAELHNLAGLLRDENQLAEARQLLERAVGHQRTALEADPQNPTYRRFLRNHYWRLAETLGRLGDHGAAARAAAELPRIYPDGWEEHHRAAGFLARCVPLAENDAKLPADQQSKLAQSYGDQAVGLLGQAMTKGFKDAEGLRKAADFAPVRSRADFQKLLHELATQQE
jgi:serine/threonine protein kinase/Flp pilus assembly protein TadD